MEITECFLDEDKRVLRVLLDACGIVSSRSISSIRSERFTFDIMVVWEKMDWLRN